MSDLIFRCAYVEDGTVKLISMKNYTSWDEDPYSHPNLEAAQNRAEYMWGQLKMFNNADETSKLFLVWTEEDGQVGSVLAHQGERSKWSELHDGQLADFFDGESLDIGGRKLLEEHQALTADELARLLDTEPGMAAGVYVAAAAACLSAGPLAAPAADYFLSEAKSHIHGGVDASAPSRGYKAATGPDSSAVDPNLRPPRSIT